MTRLSFMIALFFACGCSSTPGDPEKEGAWKEVEVHSPSDRMLWQLTLLSLQNMGFPLGSGLDPTAGVVQTGWKTELQPFRGQGTRARAYLRLEPLEPGLWKVRARVQRERNMALAAPLDPQRAEWKEAPDDETAALILLRHIQARLDSGNEPALPAPDPLAGRGR